MLAGVTDTRTRSYPERMTAVVVGEHPDFEAWLERRRSQGLDGHDEVWKGTYHVAPHEHSRNGQIAGRLIELLSAPAQRAGLHVGGSFNLGVPDDYRVPDLGYHRQRGDLGLFVSTAALVVEVLSPGDESIAKLPFYADRGVDEVWLVDPLARTVVVHVLHDGQYAALASSPLTGLGAADVIRLLDWP